MRNVLFFFNVIQLVFLLILAPQNLANNKKINNNDTKRYFAVETARGYIVINREYGYIHLPILISMSIFI